MTGSRREERRRKKERSKQKEREKNRKERKVEMSKKEWMRMKERKRARKRRHMIESTERRKKSTGKRAWASRRQKEEGKSVKGRGQRLWGETWKATQQRMPWRRQKLHPNCPSPCPSPYLLLPSPLFCCPSLKGKNKILLLLLFFYWGRERGDIVRCMWCDMMRCIMAVYYRFTTHHKSCLELIMPVCRYIGIERY